jgi:hypothetical protein
MISRCCKIFYKVFSVKCVSCVIIFVELKKDYAREARDARGSAKHLVAAKFKVAVLNAHLIKHAAGMMLHHVTVKLRAQANVNFHFQGHCVFRKLLDTQALLIDAKNACYVKIFNKFDNKQETMEDIRMAAKASSNGEKVIHDIFKLLQDCMIVGEVIGLGFSTCVTSLPNPTLSPLLSLLSALPSSPLPVFPSSRTMCWRWGGGPVFFKLHPAAVCKTSTRTSTC